MARLDDLPMVLGFAVLAYLSGSVNLSIVAARLLGIDGLRQRGSGNPGVTNLFRAAGGKVALPVLVLELLKAVLAVRLVALFGAAGAVPFMVPPYVIGNLFPIFHGFRGGKGVAAAVGAFSAMAPRVMLLGGGVFLLFFAVSRRVSASSLAMVASYPLWMLLLGADPAGIWVAVGTAAALFLTHRQNLARLVRGEEPRLKRGDHVR